MHDRLAWGKPSQRPFPAFAKKTTKQQNIKKFLKGVSERETIFKMFPSHGRGFFEGSQISPEG